ncbi:hypothetical protein [Devosia sp.]|uniref:hypothetical protein n=1 Tax=Devosia sp. TaxID=1871048 RepID=UPI003A918C3F
MSSPRGTLRAGLLALGLATAVALSACSGMTPLYGDAGIGSERIAFRYAAPASRLDQIIYQHLVLKLGRTADAAAPLVSVTTSTSSRGLTRTNVSRPAAQNEAVVTARITLTDAAGQQIYAATRSAAALYTTDSQALAATESAREAQERAARELAEIVRLTLLGALARPAAQ